MVGFGGGNLMAEVVVVVLCGAKKKQKAGKQEQKPPRMYNPCSNLATPPLCGCLANVNVMVFLHCVRPGAGRYVLAGRTDEQR